ncbi:MAG: rhomboid family intramembrane serine protease [Cytophagaceae bacterium]|nr:rhomboid family intramembrane serine protease [Gemmatimonadaceae bacterium]
MIPISDDNPTLRTPVMTWAILLATIGIWFVVQGGGFDAFRLAASVCEYGMVPGEVSHQAALGTQVPMGQHDGKFWACSVDAEPINFFTPITSMFLHGSWAHLLGNCLFLWVFGNNVEDSMGRVRFLSFYVVCGLVAAGAHIAFSPASPIPTVGASGAISGVLGAYLLLYPRVRVKVLIPIIIIPWIVHVRAWVVLLMWFAWQVLSGIEMLGQLRSEVSGGVAVWAHVGGFVAGLLLIRLFVNRDLVARRTALGDAKWAFEHEPQAR